METLTPRQGRDDKDEERAGVAVVRATYLAAGSGLGAVVLLTVLSGLGGIGGTAAAGIAVVGTIMTAAFGVAALHLRRRR
jgi:hypothetical protein